MLVQIHELLRKIDREAAGAYFLFGEAEFLSQDLTDRLRRVFSPDEHHLFFWDARFDWDALDAELEGGGLFSQRKFITLNLGDTKSVNTQLKPLLARLQYLDANSVFVIQAKHFTRAQKQTATFKALIDATTAVQSYIPKGGAFAAWIAERATLHHVRLSDDAVAYLTNAYANNLQAIDNLCRRYAVLGEQAPIDAQSLKTVISAEALFETFHLSEALLDRDFALCRRILDHFEKQSSASVPVVWQLGDFVHKMIALSNPENAVKSIGLPAFAVQRYQNLARTRPTTEWSRFYPMLMQLDEMSKGFRRGDIWRQLENLCRAIIAPQAVSQERVDYA